LGAVLLTVVLLALAWQLKRAGLKGMAWLVLLALGGQVALGISNVIFHLPLAIAVAHNAGGAGLMLTLVLVNYRARSALSWAVKPVPRRDLAARHHGHGRLHPGK
jgi:cytochrome c oxidase assembly protein subunit 15